MNKTRTMTPGGFPEERASTAGWRIFEESDTSTGARPDCHLCAEKGGPMSRPPVGGRTVRVPLRAQRHQVALLKRSRRREVVRVVGLLGLGSSSSPRRGVGHGTARCRRPRQPWIGPKIYKALGVRPFINCRGTFTVSAGNIELPEVRAAKTLANQQHAQLDELEAAVGKRLAELTGAEWGMVSAGCAAAMSHATAACVAGGNPEMHVRISESRPASPRTKSSFPTAVAQRLRRRDPRDGREDHRGRNAGGAAARDRAEDRDDLHLWRAAATKRGPMSTEAISARSPRSTTCRCSWTPRPRS